MVEGEICNDRRASRAGAGLADCKVWCCRVWRVRCEMRDQGNVRDVRQGGMPSPHMHEEPCWGPDGTILQFSSLLKLSQSYLSRGGTLTNFSFPRAIFLVIICGSVTLIQLARLQIHFVTKARAWSRYHGVTRHTGLLAQIRIQSARDRAHDRAHDKFHDRAHDTLSALVKWKFNKISSKKCPECSVPVVRHSDTLLDLFTLKKERQA